MKTIETEYCIIGAGVIGLTVARELSLRGKKKIIVCEKEPAPGMHASGRNSGVLHAGIYYTTGSLKANTCFEGNKLMKAFCRSKGVRVLENGKVIVAKNEEQIETLHLLAQRAKNNGVDAAIINEKRLAVIEPWAKTHKAALHSPHTAVVEPATVMQALHQDCMEKGVMVLCNTPFKGFDGHDRALAGEYIIRFDKLINCAGAHGDTIAHYRTIARHLTLVPFKGIYKKLKSSSNVTVNGNIYPAPDAGNPFLGVHFTAAPGGDVYVGPTAMPVFGREHYGWVDNLSGESIGIGLKDALLFMTNKSFRSVAVNEPKKYIPCFFYDDAKALVRNLRYGDLQKTSKAGIRPQLVDWNKKELVMDFCICNDENTVHVLNAISPAFTSSLYFAKIIVDRFC